MKKLIFCMLAALSVCGCVTKRTVYDQNGVITDEKYIIKRPVKNFIQNVEVE